MEGSSIRSRYTEESNYSKRVPSPPRIRVTLPDCPDDYHPRRLNASNGDPTLDALRFLDEYSDERPAVSPSFHWTYAMRYQAQQILPFLYLGPMNAVGNRSFLQTEGITMLLAVRPTVKKQSLLLNRALAVADELGLQKGTIDVIMNSELIASLPVAARMINEHLIRMHAEPIHGPGKVLVFCETGNDRSALVVIAYMMQMFVDMDLVKAIQNVQSRRLSINVNEDMKFLLSGYWDILMAKQDVAAYTQQVSASNQNAGINDSVSSTKYGGVGLKRGHDTFAEEDTNDAESNEMNSDERDFAPFRDA